MEDGTARESAWQSLGNVALVDRRTASSTPSAKRPITSDPTTPKESRILREWAESIPVGIPTPASKEQITKHLEFLASTLPSKSVDDAAGKKRFAVYVSMLLGFSNEALTYMSRQVCATLNWFPTPHQCLHLAKEYRAPASEKKAVLLACDRFDQRAFEEWVAALPGVEEPDLNVPAFWINSALTRALLRKLDDGRIVTRDRYRQLTSSPDGPATNA